MKKQLKKWYGDCFNGGLIVTDPFRIEEVTGKIPAGMQSALAAISSSSVNLVDYEKSSKCNLKY